MEKQVRSLQESYSLLSNEALKQLQEAQYLSDEKMEEKVNKVIAGVIDQTTGEVLSVFQSILKGFIDYDTGIRLLENQLILSGIISPELGVCYDLEEAKAHALIDEQTLLQLQELSNAKKLISESSLSNLPVVSALEQGLISEPLAIKILENQLSSGHLILPSTGENLTLQNAFQRNLISPTLYTKLLERQDTCKDLIDPNCAEKISLEQMVHRSIIHEETGLRLLSVKPQEKGRITFKCGRKITVLRAAHEGLIDRETMFRLLGAQLMSGGIIDPDSGKRMTVEEAMRQGMIDQDTACGILTHQVQTGGILCPNSGQRLTVDEAVQCNLISSTSALLVLEAQRGFVGLIWPHTGEIFPISTSLHQEMITNELAFKILNDRQKIAALYIPETCEIVSLDKAAQSGIIDINTLSVLTNVTLPDKMPSVEELESPCKNAAKWLSVYEFLPSVFHDCEEEHEDSGTEDPVCHNLDQAKKLFISYLMVNSYMDANTGGRLLLYDGQLQDAINMLLEGDGAVYNADVSEMEFNNKYVSLKEINLKSAGSVHFNNVTGSVQGDLSGAENTSNNRKLNQCEDFGNYISLQGEDLHVCRPDICNAIGTEQSEYTQKMLSTNPTELRNVVSSTQHSMNRNALRGLLEVSGWTELCKHNSQKANSGNVEGYLPNDSNSNLISETKKEEIYMADSLGNENRNGKTLQNSLSVNDLSDNEIWRELERCTKYGPHILQADNSRMVLANSKKDDFQRRLGSSISADTEYRLPEELGSQCGDTLQFEDNEYSEQPLQHYGDVHNRPSLEDYLYVHGRPSLEDCTDLRSKLCGDMHCRPSLDGDTVIHDGPPLGDSNSTAQKLAVEESNLTFHKLLLCDSSSDSSEEGSDGIPQFESNCLQHECGEVASEDDSSQFDDDDDDAYETPQVDDDDSDVYDTPQIDDDDSYGTPQGDDGFDTLQLGDDDTPETELSGASVPLGFLEERGGLITLREETSSFQELATNAGEGVHVNLTGPPESINIASASAETMERIPEEEKERTGSFGEKEQKLQVTLESEGRKEGGLSSLWKIYEAEVRDRNEEDEMKAESDSYEDESEGTEEEEDYEEDYDSYDDSDTDSDSDEEMGIFYSHHQCINKGDQLIISLGDTENSDENNQNIDDCCYSLGHKTAYTLQFQSSHENGKLSSGRCESASDVSEERCIGLTCASEEDRQQETEDEYGTCVKVSQDTTEPIQSENTFDTKWTSCKSEEKNKTQLKIPSSQLLDDTVTSDISVTAFLITKQATDDDESTQTNLLLSECFIDGMNKNNTTMPMLHSNHGQRQREAVFAEEKVLNDITGMERLKESSSQMDNKFLMNMPYMSDGDSSLSDQVHPVTGWKHGQIGRGFEILTENKNRVNTMEECDMGLSKSPIQMESLGEIFDASVIKAGRETPVSSKEKVNVDQALLDIGGGAKSDEFKRDFNISASLKQYTTDIKESGHSDLDKTESSCFEDRGRGKKGIQNEKDFLLYTEEMPSSEFNTYSFPPTDTVKPKEISITKETGRVICQNTDNVLKDFSENKSSNDSEFSPIKADALGSIEGAKESGDGSEALPSGSHTHTTDVSSAVLSSIGAGLNYGAQKQHEMLKNTKGENFIVSETSSPGNGFKKQMSMESLQKERGPCEDFQVKEGISQLPEMSDTLMGDLKNILQRKLKMGHVYCKQEGEPLNYSDTKILMQNLFTMVRSTQLGSDTSSGSNLKQISNAVRTALMVTTPCTEPKDSDALSLLWPDCRSPDLLRDILKQESCKQKTDDPGERKSERDMKAPVPKLTTSELLEIFQISPGDESTSKLEELISGLLTSSQVAGITTEREGKGKVDGLHTLFSTEQSEFGSEIAKEKTLADDAAVAWKSDQEHRKTDSLFKGFTEPIFKTKAAVLEDTPASMVDGVQQCLKLTEKMQGHLAVLQDMKSHLDNQQPISNNLEILKDELEQLESFESGLATFAIILKKDMKLTEEFLKFYNRDIPEEKLKELKISYEYLQEAFLVVCDTSSKRAKQIVCAVDLEMSKLAVLHQQLLSKLQRFSDWITENGKIVNDFIVNTNDIEEMKKSLQLFKNSAAELGCKKTQLESTAFDVQFFISEHAQDLSPNQSKQLLRLLNTTQKSFQEVQEAIISQVESLETQLQAAQELGDQKDVAERQQECKEKLQEICDLLTQTENRLIGQQESLVIGDSKAELEQYQTKQEEIQKDMRMSAQTLAEIVKNTETFLKENGEKLSQEDKTVLEQKLNEAKTKCLLLSQKAEESKKELDKAMTTAIKQETEKVAAIEQLEESKNTIENLLDWLSNVDKEAEHGRKFKQAIEQNGTHFEEGDVKALEGEEDDVNGNLLEIQQDIETRVDGLVKSTEDNLNQQYQKVKAQHEKIISQQQAVIIATQSAQALLEKQGHYLSPEEKDKMQRNMKELKAQYETALAELERKMKLTHSLREELEKFHADYSEFETWLQQAEQELDNLEAGASDFSGIMVKLKRQKSFSEDVISHKGDLRYITISGQRVLDAARSCSKRDGVKVDKDGIDTSATYAEVQNKLDSASDRFKSLYTKAQHEKIISQQQAVIIATQSAQALLEKQGHYLSPEEKDKMQRNMKELKAQYETALAELERKMKLTHSLREELEKFHADYSEFETWLQQAEQELDNLEAGASDFSGIMVKLKRQKSFSEDVISHKGDLRYITISGQRVLDAARSCSKRDGVKVDKDGIDTSATYAEVQNKLDSASDRFKSLYTKCSILGNNLKDLVDKYQHYEDASSGLLSGLQASEIAVNKQLSEPIAVDPKNLQRQLEETKILQGQVSNHQIAVEKLKKAAEVLLDTRGELTPDKDEIQKTLDDVVDRYDNLSKSVNERNEKLQITLTRSLSVQDGLDEMLDWMEGVEKSLEEQDQVPLNSAAIQDIISKSIMLEQDIAGRQSSINTMNEKVKKHKQKTHPPTASTLQAKMSELAGRFSEMLEQDIAGRQSSINTMNEKVKKFTETADPSTASTLQAKMSELAGRFSEASNKHKEKLMKMEELKTKVELFEGLSEKLQSFLDEKNQALSETEAPRKDVSEVYQYMQEASVELAQHKKDLEVLQQLLEELSFHALPGDKALVLEKVNALSKKFREVEEAVKEKEEDVSSCQKQMDTFELLVESLKKWIKETTERIPAAQPSLNTEELKKPLEDTLNLKDEWTLKAPELQKMNSRGTLLCNLITAVTSPAKLRAVAKSGGTMLNGEGGAPGTQDFLKNKELTTVQQAMSDVNHSYEDLGVLLKEKISELESMLSKMQNIQEESTSMMQWLQKMDKTASDWEAAPTDSEAVKAQVEQHKLFETELKQSANKVQELKDKVTELLEKNPDSPEAPKWRQMLDKIDSKWKELNQVTSERQQKLEESSNYLTQFQTAEAQLKHWLVEKELMVSVLGPLSIDPNMLNTQKQQVQILLKEFDTRKPQYEQLTMAGEGILKRPGERSPSHEIVKEQLAAVAQKWDSLTGQLRNRCDRIDQAIVKSTEYQSLLRSLSDKLSALDSKLSSSLAVSTQPDAVKQQLEIAREMKEEIEQEMKNINAAQALCEELSTLVGEEYLKAELMRQLDGILKSFKDIEQKSDNHVQQLQSAYAASHQFQQMSKDFQAWLGKKKEELNQAYPVSAKLDALQSLIEEQKDFKKTMTDQISSYERIVAEGESILQKTQGADKAALQSQIATLRSNWDEMNKQVKERQDKLTDCLEKALKYKQHVENLQPWIEKCQSNLCELKVGINPVEIENSIVQVKAWQKDLDKHHGMVELLNNSAESLLSASQTDKEIIQEETKVLNQKVNVVTEQLHKKRECLENMAQRLKEFQESSRETEKQLKSAKEHLEAHDSLGPQSFSNKHLTMMQAQQKALQALKPHVDLAKKLAQDLVVEASDPAGVSDLLLQAESLEREYTAVNQQVEDRCSFLETKLQGIGHFQNSIREMFSQFAEFDDELDSMAPVGRDLEVLQSQRGDIKRFLKKLEDLIINNENANKNCKMMLATEAEASPDLVGIKRDLEALNKQCNKLLDRAKAREDQVEGTISRVEEFYSKLEEFSCLLGRAEEHEESQGPVGMETETINQQLNTFKVFQKEEIEPLQVKQQEVNWLGQGLIQSAAKSTNTENLEHDLEDVNTRWKTLNKKVAQRAAQLQEALLHCGRFQDALESLLSWLIDTEDLVANQKPPSAEFKVVKAQIQEQKLLQRLLDDRKPTVEVIKREGEKIAESAEPADRVKILKQLSFLDSRWDALLSKAETRNRQLEGISVVAQQFHEALEPLVEWLTTTEKRLANAEPIGTQASKLQQQISQHKALEDDVLAHNKSLHQAISTGQSLKTMSSREDKDMVQEKLDSSQARYIEIQEKSNSRSELLQQAYSNAQIFGEDEVELMNWLNEIHDKLSKLSVQDCNTELLEKQHSELLDLQEEIFLRKQNVDLAIQNGLELLKQTTGDEVVIIQDKLEGIKARYKDITKLSSDVSKTLEQALQLAGQLHSTHEELCKWLDKMEVELLSYETHIPKGEELSQVQERQKELKKEAKNNKGLLDTLNEVGSAFLELVPWRAREGLDKMITEDNERYRLVSDTISQKVDEIDAAILRSQKFDQAADAEFAWIAETEKKLMSLGDIRLEQDQTMAQLQVQKAFTMEILRHKDTIDELVKSGDKIMNTCTEEEKQTMKKKMESLLQKYDAVCQMNSERNLQLERAQSLVNQFWETYEELWPWLTETEMIISQLPAPALEYETLKQQQEEHRQLRELIAEHKPHIDKMNKTGPQLLELSPGEGFSIQEKYVAADTLYGKIKEDVKKRALALDEAISQCTQFHDKIDPTLESLKRIVERLRQPPSISAEVEKIKEQISENKNVSVDLEKLQPVYETLKQRGEEMIARSEGADKDISAKAVQDKLDQMVLIWEDIQTLTEEREAKLLDVMELAEKFWCDHMALVATIKDTQDFIRELEGPGVDPSVVKQQQEAAEAAKEEIDGLQEELETVVSLGSELRAACGEPDKPIVNKSIDELNSAWDALNKTWKERVDKLVEAMQAAVQYQDGLQAIFDWVDIAGSKLASMSPVGTDLETVKQQTEELKQFKTEAYQQQIEMERLNHQAELLLKKVTEESDKHAVQDPLSELKLMWDSLEEKIINRQHKLEGALLALGQFQHALDELLTWLTHTEDLLNEQKPVGGDPKAIEIELAKHHVLQNDVLAHQSTVEAVKKAGNDLIESSAVEEASNLRSKLELLNQRWQNVLEKTEQRKQQLDSALIQAQGFHGEVEDMQQWLTDTERQLLASKPVGGLPETAREQLNTHMELCAAFEAKEETYKCLMQKGQQMLARCPESAETNVEQDINNLKEKWESVQTKLSERKTKLEEALNLAMEFHNSLQDFINWLTQAEQTLTAASRPSLILDTVLFQIDEHKVFATEVNSHRDQIIELDKTGTHLKYFSQKQDVVLIKNLLISVQSRWEKVVQRLVERGRALDDARKRAKQFHEAWHKLMEWLEESEKSLDSDLEIANDPDKIKMQLAQHKEFQKSLGAKHSVYDTTNRTGRSLKEKTTLADDNLKLDDMLSELRDKWDTICGKSVERQNKLEEALLFSGQFTDALQALIDWLYKIEPQLAEDQPVHGDIDLVMNLIDNHKVFQKELGKRTSSVQALKRSARELIEGSRDDSSWVKVQMQELSTRWETVCALSVSKQTRLEQALRQAEEFHSVVHVLLEWLAEAGGALRFHGVLPDDEEALRTLIDQHREFMKKLEEKKAELNKATGMGEAILAICHPDSITTIKHWITIIRARFEEVLAWAKQHQQRLAGALAGLIANQELLEALLSWLQWAETTLTEKDKEVIPQEIEEVKALIAEHQTFMEEMTRKQPDVDKVTKTYKRKALEPTPVQSHIPVLDKGRAGRKRSPTPGIYPSAAQAQIETKNPRVNLLVSKWQQVWLLALERRRKLNDALDRLEELREFANFDFDIWRKKYMRWMNHKKSRVMDFFRRIDKDQDGKITRQEFIDGILSSKFPTSRLEMSAVADIFDRDGDGYIDYYEFVAALHPNKDAYKPLTDADKIEDEVTRQVAKCKCAKRFQVEQIGDNKYRFFLGNQFGDSQQLRLVRILRSTVMVRVGGGWMALDEFLVKNDPCRVHHHGSKMLRSESNSSITTQPTIAKGRTNVELREKFILADGASQSMAAFRPRGRRSRPSSRAASPNRSTSLSSQAGQAAAPQAVATSTPKTPHHLTRNYGKPWLTNSKTSTPSKPPESSDYQGSSAEGTPIQGSKLRLPGYLSGKGFHSGEDSGILSTAATRVRAQFAETRRTPSRPGSRAGSKAGSRSSSRRGSDASDFDISEIQSVCSDMSETVPATSRPTPRAGSRPGSAKPSKIPTPQRRPLASKLDKSLKR
ncbi:PREDICTED: dystonin-like [Aptenodytes forsteri]|uniref:dystonin-like n=1 Tax=Aptenodytes forsteri TaxID=9233 RepID=UPI0004F49A44|nr:PREDICTED: dystonin-like [Aptenodytes forsteri]